MFLYDLSLIIIDTPTNLRTIPIEVFEYMRYCFPHINNKLHLKTSGLAYQVIFFTYVIKKEFILKIKWK